MPSRDTRRPSPSDAQGKVVSLGARRRRNAGAGCPICGRDPVAEHRPFCSARCKDVDLGRWFKGAYRIPTDETPEPGEPPPDED
jgi:endogenous inhibitor of DNA gyrase (YacG/DUF329 family)